MTTWLPLAAVGTFLLLVPWVIYPWAMIRLAGASASASVAASPPEGCVVSVVLATRDPPEAVLARVQDLVHGDWPAGRLELVVAIDGDPAPYQFAGLQPSPRAIRVVSRGNDPGKAAALNAGVAAATGDILVFTDTAQRFAPDAIPRLVGALAGGPYAAVSGALRIGNEEESGGPLAHYWRLERRLREAEARRHSAIGVSGSIYAMRRSHWTPLPAGLILDDLWVPMRLILAGQRVGFEPRAVAFDTRTTTPQQEYPRKVRTLTGNLQLVAWMPGVLLPWRNPVWIQFWCHKLLRLATPWAGLLIVIGTIGAAFTISPSGGKWLLAAGTGSVLVSALSPGQAGRTVRGGLRWGLMMLAAVVAATWNGLRGRWDVWGRA
jgi:cellulose synthase/poly-beta-1,6-N-acetylglucosamine synthase-like glycosyltransferase